MIAEEGNVTFNLAEANEKVLSKINFAVLQGLGFLLVSFCLAFHYSFQVLIVLIKIPISSPFKSKIL